MLTKIEIKERIPYIEKWLDERWAIANMDEPPRPADLAFYKGAMMALEYAGFHWKRFENGKHTVY